MDYFRTIITDEISELYHQETIKYTVQVNTIGHST